MARQAGDAKYFLARKAPKLYMTGVFQSSVKSLTTEKEQTLNLDTDDADLRKGKRIHLGDEGSYPGKSLHALEHGGDMAGGEIAQR